MAAPTLTTLPDSVSYVVVAPRTGRVVCETYERTSAETLQAAGYIVTPALAYLVALNASLKASR